MRAQIDSCRARIARIRCLKECLKCFAAVKPFPNYLCYTCREVEFSCSSSYLASHSDIATYSNHFFLPDNTDLSLTESLKYVIPVGTVACDINTKFFCSGEPIFTKYGVWQKLFTVKQGTGANVTTKEFNPPVWVLTQGTSSEEPAYLEPENRSHEIHSSFANNWKYDDSIPINHWMSCIESQHSLTLSRKAFVAPADTDTVSELQEIPPGWSSECDEQLVHLLADNSDCNSSNLGTIKNYVDQITVSTTCGNDDENTLTDGNNETFWESDGNHGQHWIRLKMKKGTVISRLYITLDMDDENYLPDHVVVAGGDLDDMNVIADCRIDLSYTSGVRDECILTDACKHYPYIEIRIKSCKDEGIDTRIRGLKISSSREAELGFSVNMFADKERLCRYPALEGYNKKILYRRAQIIQRLTLLIDSVLNFIVPSWNTDSGSATLVQNVKHLLPLSTKRMTLLDSLIKDSESRESSVSNSNFPKVVINRRTAAEHRANPSADPDGVNSVFHQIYEGLKQRSSDERPLDYRWPGHCSQWWECKFVSEGIIDQGGGFRDSLCDLAEELCPSDPHAPVPLTLFVRAPNQTSSDGNTSRDVFVPNPSCTKFPQYSWLGKLMGACFRSRENLVLALPGFVWKKISNEKVDWAADYSSVDTAEVRLLETLETTDQESFQAHFSERTWTVTLSNGTVKELVDDGENTPLLYEDRLKYGKLAREVRMAESDDQVRAIREGFLSVVPEAALNLITWREIEIRICGNPEITIEELRKSVHLDELEASDERMKMFWEAMTNFSYEDRSRFLRFVTGRKRLPCPLYISPNKASAIDCLPESSTCSNTLYLPRYSSITVAEQKLRYAAYNCVAIDTDLNPWE